MNGGGRDLVRLFLPFLFSVLPLFFLAQDLTRNQELLQSDRQRESLEQKRNLVPRLQQLTTPGFWMEETARALKARVEATLAAGIPNPAPNGVPSRLADDVFLAQAIDQALPGCRPAGVPPVRVWAVAYPGTDPDQAQTLLKGKTLESTYRFMFLPLLRKFGRDFGHRPLEIDSKTWLLRIQGAFGEGASLEQFSPGFQGRAFHVVFQNQYGLAAWELIRKGDQPVGAMFLLMPLPPHHRTLALEACLRNWTTLSGQNRHFPVFFPFLPDRKPGETRPQNRILTPAALPAGVHRPFIRGFWRQMFTRRLRADIPLSFLNLPADALYRIRETPEADGLLCLPGSFNGHLAYLLSVRIPPTMGLTALLLRIYALLLLPFWTMLSVFLACGGRLPEIGVRADLLLRLLGIVATPIALTLGAGNNFLLNVSSNAADQVRRNLGETIRNIDTGSQEMSRHTLGLCRDLVRDPGFLALLTRIGTGTPTDELARFAFEHCKQKGLELSTFMLFGRDDLAIARVHPAFSPETAEMTIRAHRFISRKLLGQPPATASAPQSPDTRSVVLETLEKNNQFTQPPGTLSHFRMGDRFSDRFYDKLTAPDGRTYCLYLSWTLDQLHRQYLQQALLRHHRDAPACALVALENRKGRIEPIAAVGDPALTGELSAGLQNATFFRRTRHAILFGEPAQEMPGFFLGAATMLTPLQKLIRQEGAFIALGLLLLLVLLLLIAIALSDWIAAPIVRMTQGLHAVAGNDLMVRFSEPRRDEIGQIGQTLNHMVQWLNERNTMSRFVSPQVLEVVARGNTSALAQGTTRTVTMLVSDIRQFTTLSEQHPPQAIFQMLNAHLNAMTPIIHRFGGTIDRFIGDAVQAVFYPDPDRPMAIRAVRAALAMMAAHQALQESRHRDHLFTYDIGIGIDAGEVVSGVLGAADCRLDFTILGEAFKTAATLEALSKGGTASRIICSDRVREGVDPFVAFQRLPGSDSLSAWEIITPDAPIPSPLPAPMETRPATLRPGGQNQLPEPFSKPSPQPIPQSTGTPVTAPKIPASGSLRRHLLPALLLAIPIFLFVLFSGLTQESRRRHYRLLPERQLEELAGLIGNIPGPLPHVALNVQMRLEQHLDRLPKSGRTPADWPGAVVAALQPFRQAQNGFAWRVFAHQPNLQDGIACSMAGSRRLSGEGAFPGLSEEHLLQTWTFLKLQMTQRSPEGFESKRTAKEAIAALFNVTAYDDLFQTCWGNWGETLPEGKKRYFLWLPVYRPEWFGREIPPLRPGVYLGHKREHLNHVLGGVFLLAPEEFFTASLTADCFRENLKGLGLEGAVMQGTQIDTTPGFKNDPGLRAGLEAFQRTGLLPVRPDWAFARTTLPWRGGTVLLAKPLEAPPPTGVITGIIGGGRWVFPVLWLLAILVCWRPWAAESLAPRLPILWPLVGGFLLVAGTAILLSWASVERSRQEEVSRLHSDQTRLLQETLQAISDSRSLHLAYTDALVGGLFDHSGPVAELWNLEERQRKKGIKPGCTAGLQKFFLSRGVRFTTAFFLGPNRFFLALLRTKENRDVVQLTFQSYSSKTLEMLNPSYAASRHGVTGRDLSMGVILDESKSLFLSAIPPGKLTEVILAPHSFLPLSGFGNHIFLFRHFITWKGFPRYCFLGRLKPDAVDFQIFNNWSRLLRRPEFGHLRFSVIPVEALLQISPRPFFRYDTEADGFVSLDALTDTVSPATGREHFLARFSDRPFFSEALSAEGRVKAIMNSRAWGDFFLKGENDFTAAIADQRSQVTQRRLLLLLVMLLSIVLSVLTARGFLAPLLALSRAAGRITLGEFSVRIPGGAAGEFGRLATAFNQVAAGVEEGRLLSCFVSESVKSVARDRADEESALTGRQTDVTVLFCGIAGFSRLLHTLPPDRLVMHLNRYLEEMTRIIRAQGGDIDKFIGDKILAVFHPDRATNGRASPGRAAENAAAAAVAMTRALRSLEFWTDHALGIGIVSGPVLAGIMGAAEVRQEFTVIGDTVNLSSRLCDLAQQWAGANQAGPGGTILVTAETRRLLEMSPFYPRLRPTVVPPIKGKSRSVEVFHLPADEPPAAVL